MGFLWGDYDHSLVFLEMIPTKKKPPSPFKLNPKWLKEEDYVNNTKYILVSFNGSSREQTKLRFEDNSKGQSKLLLNGLS